MDNKNAAQNEFQYFFYFSEVVSLFLNKDASDGDSYSIWPVYNLSFNLSLTPIFQELFLTELRFNLSWDRILIPKEISLLTISDYEIKENEILRFVTLTIIP